MPRMTADEIDAFLDERFPQARRFGYEILELDDEHLLLGLATDERHLRPGGTVAGPVLMTLADTAAFLILLAQLGPVALAVTTSLNINFMRKPEPGQLHARAEILKLGKRLAVTEVRIYAEEPKRPVAHATVTYSLPG